MEQDIKYDIFISYKRQSLPTANNLYYRLTTRGYSTFFDLEEMRRDNFNVQLLNYIEKAKDVFVLLEEGSLDACKQDNWKEDWFCKEIAHAIKTKRNIIPILIGGYKMPKPDFFPDELKELAYKNSPEFSFAFFEEYLNKLIEKGYITSTAQVKNQATSIFKFYSNDNCQIFKDGKLVCNLNGHSDEPYYLPVLRKGDYTFKCVKSSNNNKVKILKISIDTGEEKTIIINWRKNIKFFISSIVLFVLMAFISFLFFENNKKRTSNIIDVPSEFYLSRYHEVDPIFTDSLLTHFMYSDSIDDSSKYYVYPIVSDTLNYFHYPIFTIRLKNNLNKTIVLNEAYLEVISCEDTDFKHSIIKTEYETTEIPSINIPVINIESKSNTSYILDFFDCTLVRGETCSKFKFAINCDKSLLMDARLKFVSTEDDIIYSPIVKISYYNPKNILLYPEYK